MTGRVGVSNVIDLSDTSSDSGIELNMDGNTAGSNAKNAGWGVKSNTPPPFAEFMGGNPVTGPFIPMTADQFTRSQQLHGLRARMERELRPNEHNVPAGEPILDVDPISVRYHLRDYREFTQPGGSGLGEYGTNIGNIYVSRVMPSDAEPSTSNRRAGKDPAVHDAGEVDAAVSGDVPSTPGDSILESSESGSPGLRAPPIADSDEDEEDAAILQQVFEEEALDADVNFEGEAAAFLVPAPPPNDSAALTTEIDGDFVKEAIANRHSEVGGRFLGLPEGYKLTVPKEEQTVADCPVGHVVVYTKMFDYGLRFPLHPFIEKVLRAWNVGLVQLSPIVIRNLVAYTWLFSFKQWPLTLNLFKKLHWLKRDGKDTGWWTIFTKSQRQTVSPRLSSCKDWKDHFYFMAVPEDYPLRRTFYQPKPRMEQFDQADLGPREQRAYDRLLVDYVDVGLSKPKTLPAFWLPPAGYILSPAALGAVGLAPTHPLGKCSCLPALVICCICLYFLDLCCVVLRLLKKKIFLTSSFIYLFIYIIFLRAPSFKQGFTRP